MTNKSREGIDAILKTASALITGDRAESYGDPTEQHKIAYVVYNYLVRQDMCEAEKAVLFMICIKLSRQRFKHKRDNLIDIAGYVALWDFIIGGVE